MIALTAENGKTGIGHALTEHPDVILMDIMMPEMNGHEAVEKLRFDSWGKHAKVIFLTNFSDPEHVVKAVEAESAEFIVKANTDVKEVINKIRTVMHT